MGKHTLRIDGWHPHRLNELLHCHWAEAAKKKKADRGAVLLAAVAARIPDASGPRRASLTITLAPRQRAGDADAYWKSLLDALVHAGLLKDDNRQWCQLGEVAFRRGPRKATEIILEDI